MLTTTTEVLVGDDFLFEFKVSFDGGAGDPQDFRDPGYVEDFCFTLTYAGDENGALPFTPVEIGEREFCWFFGNDQFNLVEEAAMGTVLAAVRSAHEDRMESMYG